MKRLFDLVMGIAALLILAVPLAVVALAVKLTSPGPILYWSDRVGIHNTIFRMPKFRSMRIDTPEVATHLLKDPDQWLTPIGSFLRKTSLDELPQLYSILKEEMMSLLEVDGKEGAPVFDFFKKPYVIMVVGVNGVGKTTTIGKLAANLKASGKKVMLGAADTFRAAAVDQLVIWSERAGVPIVKQKMGADPASVAYDTVTSALAQDVDVVLIDTAGRLHNKINLMNELTKIRNVMRKVVPDAPHEVLLVLDGSTGQNAFVQAREFTKATDVTALAVTKLDGTAKGGVVLGIADQFNIPVKFIGVGEGIEDLQIFDKKAFVDSLFD